MRRYQPPLKEEINHLMEIRPRRRNQINAKSRPSRCRVNIKDSPHKCSGPSLQNRGSAPWNLDENTHKIHSTTMDHSKKVMLQSIYISILNSPDLVLACPERTALLETFSAISKLETATQVRDLMLEAIQTCGAMFTIDKDLLVHQGVLGQRWDLLYEQYPSAIPQIRLRDPFLSYRCFVLVLLRTSRKIDWTPQQQKQVKAMILSTKTREQLDHLLHRILYRCLAPQDAYLIHSDLMSFRYYRLLWASRLDCESPVPDPKEYCDRKPAAINDGNRKPAAMKDGDRKPPAVDDPRQILCGGAIDIEADQTDSCPICLDPIHNVGTELACGHTFCSRCIGEWIQYDPNKQHARRWSRATSGASWHCPMCRQSYRGVC